MEAFIEQHWLSIISLIVAALGGIPGILAVVNHFKSSAKLSVKPSTVMFGDVQFNSDSIEYTVVFIALTVSNEGEKNLSPAVFDLAIKKERSWIQLERRLIPKNIQFHSQKQTIEIREPWKKDLQRYSGAISHGIPLSGFLFFVTDKLSRDELQSMGSINFRCDCVDIFDKRHRVTFLHKGDPIDKNTVYPKHDLSVSIPK